MDLISLLPTDIISTIGTFLKPIKPLPFDIWFLQSTFPKGSLKNYLKRLYSFSLITKRTSKGIRLLQCQRELDNIKLFVLYNIANASPLTLHYGNGLILHEPSEIERILKEFNSRRYRPA